MDGFGKMTYSNSSVYEGEWKDSERHGTGRFVDSTRENAVYTGRWDRGRRQGAGEAQPAGKLAPLIFAGEWNGSAMVTGVVSLPKGIGCSPNAKKRGKTTCRLHYSSGVPQFVSQYEIS